MTSLAIILFADNILAIDGSFIFIFVSILLLIFILNATLFRPINRVLEEREKMGGGTAHAARDLIKEYDKKVMQYEDGIRNARHDAYQHLENQRRDALAERQDLVTQAKTDVTGQIDQAKAEIAAQTEAARNNLAQEARAIAAQISTNVLRRPVNAPEGIGLQ